MNTKVIERWFISFGICGALWIALMLSGCTHFKLEQKDQRDEIQVISTKLSGTAWLSSAQNLSKIAASQTEKTQRFGFDGVNQHGATNAVVALEAIARILEALRPMP